MIVCFPLENIRMEVFYRLVTLLGDKCSARPQKTFTSVCEFPLTVFAWNSFRYLTVIHPHLSLLVHLQLFYTSFSLHSYFYKACLYKHVYNVSIYDTSMFYACIFFRELYSNNYIFNYKLKFVSILNSRY